MIVVDQDCQKRFHVCIGIPVYKYPNLSSCVCSMLAEDFVRLSIHDPLDLETSALLTRFNARVKGLIPLMMEFDSVEVSHLVAL